MREKYPIGSNEEAGEALYDDPGALGRELAALVQRTSEKDKIKKMPALEKLLSKKASALGPDLVAHVVRESGVHIDDALDQSGHSLAAVIENIAARLNDAWVLLRGLDAADASKGYVYADAEGKVCHFAPVLWAHRNNEACSEHPTLDRAVDAYFSEMEMKKDARDEDGARKRALKKVNAIKADHERRVAALDQKARERTRAAELVAMNAWIVDRAISVIRQAVDSGMDWEALERLLQRERDMGDDVAELVVGLKLDVNKITLRLHEDLADAGASSDDSSSDSDDDGNKRALRPMKIDVDITLSAHGNARKLFEDKKLAKEKASRTREASEKVISDLAEKADQAVQRELKRKNATQGIRESRKAMWFEKFDWFVTSEGLLVISGRDAQQNELLVKRYLRASHCDVYVHADIHGAATCILRNPFGKGSTLPAESLRQAGAMAVARSAAWGAKVIAGAWWVHASQVSKTAPSGEYLSTGSFMVRGKKNYLPPAKLELGFGFIFKVDVTALGDGEDEVATVNPPTSGDSCAMTWTQWKSLSRRMPLISASSTSLTKARARYLRRPFWCFARKKAHRA